MVWQGWLSLGLVGVVLALLIATRLRPHVVMLGALTVLVTSGVLSAGQALAGFANEGLATVAAMFVVAGGIQASGGAELIVQRLLGRPTSARGAMLRLFAPVALLSAFLNNTPIVATMIPAVNSWARRINVAPSKLMIPLSYAAILGGTLTLVGTSTNLVVNGQYRSLTGAEGFSLFAITAVGLPVALAGAAFMWLFFARWLPEQRDNAPFANLREFTLEVAVAPGGPLVGKTVEQAGLRHLVRVYLVEIEREEQVISPVGPDETLCGGDRLVFAGDTDAIADLLRINGVVPSTQVTAEAAPLRDRAERRLVEVVVSPHCAAVGQAIRDAQFRDRYGAAVLAVARNGERVRGNLGSTELVAGDALLLEAGPDFVTRQRHSRDFLLVNDLATEPPRHDRLYLAWCILLGVMLAAGTGILSMLNAALIGALLMLLAGCCSLEQAERSLDLTVLLTIGASFALGAALEQSGAALFLAQGLISLGADRPWLLLVLTYFTVSVLTEVITNNAAAILMLPIALSVAANSGLDPEPFVLAIMMAASASFATPLGYQTNLMVYGPGGYRFTDFLRVGVPMNLFIGAVTLGVLLLGWPLVPATE
jgi:di/tricarboxylate transporter